MQREWLVVAALWVFVPLVALTRFLHGPGWLEFTPVIVMWALLALSRFWRSERRGRIEVDETNVRLEGEALLSRRSIREAHALPTEGRHVVRVSTGSRLFEVTTATAVDAHNLLAALGFDRAQRAARHDVHLGTSATTLRRLVLVLIQSVLAGVAAGAGFLERSSGFVALASVFALGALVALVAGLRAMVTLTIGTDGLLLKRKVGRAPRFIRFDRIERVERQGTTMTIVLTDGPPVQLNAGIGGTTRNAERLRGSSLELEKQRMEVAAAQIEEAKRASEGASSASAVLVSRNGRGASAWMRALVATNDASAGYRVAALSPETLWQIVDDTSASASARAGAAVALRARLDEEGRQRLRVASETCASPALRVALSAAAHEPDAVVEDALAFVEDDEIFRKTVGQRY